VTAVAFACGDGPLRLASASADGSVRLWRPDAGDEATIVLDDPKSSVMTIAFSPRGHRLASGDVDGRLRIWDVAEVERSRSTYEEMESITAIAMSPDGQLVATGGADGRVRIRDVESEALLRGPEHPNEDGEVASMTFSRDGDHLVWGGGGGRVRVWSQVDGRDVAILSIGRSVRAVAVAPDGRVAAACGDGNVRVWIGNGPEPLCLRPKLADVSCVAFAPDGRVLSGGTDARLWAWQVDSSRGPVLLAEGEGSIGAITCSEAQGSIAFGCGRRIGIVGADGVTRYLEGHPDDVNALAFSADGTMLASAAVDGSAYLVDARTGDVFLRADAGVLGLGLAWTGGPSALAGSRVALLLDNAVLIAAMVDDR
jgi:WD40 repeat protein